MIQRAHSGKGTALRLPLVPSRQGYLLDDDGEELHAVEIFALLFDAETEETDVLARYTNSVASLQRFPGRDIAFSEGTALRLRLIRANNQRFAKAG
jgi:hypothetical protein